MLDMSLAPTDTPTAASSSAVCRGCGYQLRDLPAARCPECGLAFDPSLVHRSVVPWEQRASVGKFRAWWLTLRMALIGWKRLRLGLAQPLRLQDAIGFHGGTKAACFFSLIAIAIALLVLVLTANPLSLTIYLFAAGLACAIFAWQYAFVHVPTLFLIRRREPERASSAKAVWYYSALPGWLLTIGGVVFAVASIAMFDLYTPPLQIALQVGIALSPLAWSPLRFAHIFAASRGGGAWRGLLGFFLGCACQVISFLVGALVLLELSLIGVAIFSMWS